VDEIKVSVVIPVYNVEEYLSDCLESILEQDFDNYEIICVDDGSTDYSGEILQAYASRYKQIRMYTHEHNRGQSAARNTGISYAKGKYIWFVDSDDMIAADSLRALYDIAEKDLVDIVYFKIKVLYEGREIYKKHANLPSYEYPGICSGRERFCQYSENQEFIASACRQFIRTDFIKKNGIRFYEGIIYEDVLFSFFCIMKAGKVLNIPHEFYVYRQRKGSTMSIKDYRCAQSMFVIIVQIVTYWNSHEFNDREHRAIEILLERYYRFYKSYSQYGDTVKLEVGGRVEKALYAMLKQPDQPVWLMLSEQQIEHIRNARHVVIFGAGRGAVDIFRQLQENGIGVALFAVSSLDDNPETLCGTKVVGVDSISANLKDAAIIVGVTEKYRAGIQEKLQQLGYRDIVAAQDVVMEEGGIR